MRPVSRRTMLRGAGAALALPWLEAFGGAAPPVRLAYLFVPNGIHMPDWTPASEGAAFSLPFVLQPLAPHRERLLLLSGLAHDKARANGDGPGDHARSAAAFLTGAQPVKTDGSGIRAGVSADQAAARRVGNRTRLPSIEIGCEAGLVSGQCDSGYSCAYSSNISWSTPQTPMAKETDPRQLFDRLFGETREGLARKKGLLDRVREDARSLSRKLGATDRRKLDEYLTGVHELERRIALAADPAAPAAKRPEGTPRDYAEHLRVMADLLALAFATDTTRIATFMLANEGSNRSYPMLGIPEGHHELSHHGGDAGKQEKIRRINRFHVETLAHLLGRLAEAREGGDSLLDRCLVVYGSGISDGNRHNHDELPVLVAGGAAAGLRTGRHLRLPRETPMNNLHLALLDRLGVDLPAFGDSTARLPI